MAEPPTHICCTLAALAGDVRIRGQDVKACDSLLFLLNDDLKNSAQAQSVESSEANHGLTAFYRKQSAVMQLFGLPRCKRVIPPDDDLQCA